MNPSITDFLIALLVAVLGAVAGAAAIYGEYDDAPGLILIGMAIGLGATVLGWKALQARRKGAGGAHSEG